MSSARAGGETEDRLQRGLGFALAQLNRRERTTGEVRAHLERKGIDEDTAQAVLELLLRDGYLDDCRYAQMYVHDKRTLEGWGSERIRRELHSRGLERDVIDAALAGEEADRPGQESEFDRAMALLVRRFPAAPRERRARDRALGMLIRKGYDPDLALEVLAAYARQV